MVILLIQRCQISNKVNLIKKNEDSSVKNCYRYNPYFCRISFGLEVIIKLHSKNMFYIQVIIYFKLNPQVSCSCGFFQAKAKG